MIYLIRNADRTIKTFMEQGADCILQPGETLEIAAGSFADYAARLKLSVESRSGETVQCPVGADVSVQISCPGQATVALEVNGAAQEIVLENGLGQLVLNGEQPGIFEIRPADRTLFCAAGEAVLTVVVG